MASVLETLDKLEADLIKEIAAARERLVPLERELSHVRRAKAALPTKDNFADILGFDLDAHEARDIIPAGTAPSPYAHLTMKELTTKALAEQFPSGATANELLDFFRTAWQRTDIRRSSLSPQLSRLKRQGDIDLVDGKWLLSLV